jgi:hypothetical protein
MENLIEGIQEELALGVDFDEELHKYTYQGKTLISCTQLLEQMGITKSFKEIEDLPAVHAARTKGIRIHDEVHHYLTCIGEGNEWCFDIPTNPLIHAPETKMFLEWFKKQSIAAPLLSEQIVFNRDYRIAGRFDMGWMDKDTYIIGDIKTAKQADLWPAAWQLALYRYMFSQARPSWKFKLLVFSFDYDANACKPSLKVDDVSNYVSNVDALDLLIAYSLGKKYDPTSVVVSSDQRELLVKASNMLDDIKAREDAVKALKIELQDVKGKLYDAMAQRSVKNLKINISDNKEISMTRVDKHFRRTFDTKTFKEDHEDIYNTYAKLSEVSPTVRVSVKEVRNEEDDIANAISRF